MTTPDEDQVQSIWRSQPILTVSLTPEQLRARAAQFENETHRRNRIDLVSFAMVALGLFLGIGAIIHGKILAGTWQREIDALKALKAD